MAVTGSQLDVAAGERDAATAGGRGGRSSARRRRRGNAIYLMCGLVITIIFIAPLIWAVIRSLQPAAQVTATPSWSFFSHWTLSNYHDLLTSNVGLWRGIANSAIVAVATAIIATVVATMAGYGFGRFKFRGSGIAFAVILITIMVPFQAVLTPLFLELQAIGLGNTRVGLVLFYVTFNLPFGVFVMRNTFEEIPDELAESAELDGAGTLRALWYVYRPLVLPGMATTFLYAFLFAWTEFLAALTFLTNADLFTLPIKLFGVELNTYGQVNYGFLVAGAVISMIPCVVLYVALQKYYVRGLTSGAVKG